MPENHNPADPLPHHDSPLDELWQDSPHPSASSPAHNPEPEPGLLNWLFVDLNSYFASVEQQVRPELRGKPVAIVPMMADTTCCIAASYEAKAFGVKTGTMVGDARRMCPGIVFLEARHELYVDYHHRIVEAVESCLPVTSVMSIDEMACRLIGRERPLLAALELGRLVKARIRERVGTCLRSSVGLATNRYLAKIASDMEKPDGLVALPLDILPTALPQLVLRDLPGIGARTEKRLNDKGITTMAQLLALDCQQAGELWGSVWGERLWHWLRGRDFYMAETEHQKSISHSHVLAPDMRTPEKAWAVAHKLLHKAAMRLRANNLWASNIGLAIGFAVPRAQQAPVSRFGVPTRGWHADLRLSECQDNPTLIAALTRLWNQCPVSAVHTAPAPHPQTGSRPGAPGLDSETWENKPSSHPQTRSSAGLPAGSRVGLQAHAGKPQSPPLPDAPSLRSKGGNHEPSHEQWVPQVHFRSQAEEGRLGKQATTPQPDAPSFAKQRVGNHKPSKSDERASAPRSGAARSTVPVVERRGKFTGPADPNADFAQPYFVGIHLNNLVPDRLHSLNLFDALEDTQSRTRLMQTMDQLNQKYGATALAPAAMLAAYKAAPTRIAFHSIPDEMMLR